MQLIEAQKCMVRQVWNETVQVTRWPLQESSAPSAQLRGVR
jgi:hypothetical protein